MRWLLPSLVRGGDRMPEGGWISPRAFQVGAVDEEAIASGVITESKLSTALLLALSLRGHAGIYDLSFYNLAVYA